MPKVIGVKLPDEEVTAFELAAQSDGYRTVAAWMRAIAKQAATATDPPPKGRVRRTATAPSQTQGYIEAIKAQRPMPPPGLSRSDLQRWYRENR